MNTNNKQAAERVAGGSTTGTVAAAGCFLVGLLNHSGLFLVAAGGLVGVTILCVVIGFVLVKRAASNPSVPFEAASRPSAPLGGPDPYATLPPAPQDLLAPYSDELSNLRRLHAADRITTEALIARIESIEELQAPPASRADKYHRRLAGDYTHVVYCPGFLGGVCNQPGPCAEQRKNAAAARWARWARWACDGPLIVAPPRPSRRFGLDK